MANDFSKIAKQLQQYKTVQGIMKYVNEESIIEQHKKQEKNKATGIDGVSKIEYEENLNKNVKELINKMKTMSYIPQDVKRVYIPKTGSTELRPLGIPAYEDRLVQGAMAEVLNEIYENTIYQNTKIVKGGFQEVKLKEVYFYKSDLTRKHIF